MNGQQYSQSQLDALAQSRGYKNYQHWVISQRNAQQYQQQNPGQGNYAAVPQGQQQRQPLTLSNWFQMLKRDPGQAFARLMPQSSGLMTVNDAFDRIGQ